MPHHPMDTNPQDCEHVAADRATFDGLIDLYKEVAQAQFDLT